MKHPVGKFDNLDRNRVMGAVQEHYAVKLVRVGSRYKWLGDASGRNWWILGGKDDFHGIPEDMMEDERQARVEGMLVIAQRKVGSIDVFAGSLGPLVSARDRLYRAARSTGDYQFEVTLKGERLVVSGRRRNVVLELKRFATIPYSAEDKERDRKMVAVGKILATLSPEERKSLIDGEAST